MINLVRTKRIAISAAAVAAIAALATPPALAGFFDSLTTAQQYAVLYEGDHNLTIKAVTITGNIGVDGTGIFKFDGPGTINGRLDFANANTGQYDNNNNANVEPNPINYSVAGVTTAISEINSLSSTVGGVVGTNIALTGPITIDASTGVLDANGNRVFNVTSYSIADGEVVNIVGNAAGDSVVLNFAFNNDVHLKGNITLGGGLTDDQVLWNFTSTNKNVSLDTNAGNTIPPSFHGIILAPNDVMLLTDANLNGRFWGGQNTKDMVLQNLSTLYPNQVIASTPEPSSVVLLLTALLLGFGTYRFRSGAGIGTYRIRSLREFAARGLRSI